MIRLPEHEDDIYINSLIRLAVQNLDKDLAFDLDAFQKLETLVLPVLRDRLALLFEEFALKDVHLNLADELFAKGYACEQGIHCSQDFKAALGYYHKAADRGCIEALFRIGWMIETGVVDGEVSGTSDEYYERAADQGHAKSLIACGQRILFKATTLHELLECREYFSKANQIDPLTDYLYIDAIDEMIRLAKAGKSFDVAENVEHIAGMGRYLREKRFPFFQTGMESYKRLSKLLGLLNNDQFMVFRIHLESEVD